MRDRGIERPEWLDHREWGMKEMKIKLEKDAGALLPPRNLILFQKALFKKYFIYLILERNINVWLALACPQLRTHPGTQACTLTGNWTGDPLIHRLVLNPLRHTSQGSKNPWEKLLCCCLPVTSTPVLLRGAAQRDSYNQMAPLWPSPWRWASQ